MLFHFIRWNIVVNPWLGGGVEKMMNQKYDTG